MLFLTMISAYIIRKKSIYYQFCREVSFVNNLMDKLSFTIGGKLESDSNSLITLNNYCVFDAKRTEFFVLRNLSPNFVGIDLRGRIKGTDLNKTKLYLMGNQTKANAEV
jgi:hypothetical protein